MGLRLSTACTQLCPPGAQIHVAQSRRSYAEGVWQGDGGEKKPLAAVLPEGSASADTLKYIAALVRNRGAPGPAAAACAVLAACISRPLAAPLSPRRSSRGP